jgi:phospho-N-acetylmuramoyl-pentapeptide-transferase
MDIPSAAYSTAPMGLALLMGGLTFALAVLFGRPLIRFLKRRGIGKQIRIDEPGSNQVKMGTPTMGGILIVTPVILMLLAMYAYTRLAARLALDFSDIILVGRSLIVPVGVMLGFAALGAIDDYMGVRGVRRGEGMRGRSKALIQVVIATIAAVVMSLLFGTTSVAIPGLPFGIDVGLLWIPIAVLIIMGSANAVNFTDGLDGLCALNSLVAYFAYGVVAYLQGQAFLTMFCMLVVGALLAFLWFNVHPAALFMGDLGSEALGGALGVVALMTGQWLLYPIIAIIPTAELVSDLLQIGYFKYTKRKYGTGKRLFKLAPFHYHFLLSGWSETQVVQRFWLINILGALLGVGLAVLGNPLPVQ